jgi:hypothetical protein
MGGAPCSLNTVSPNKGMKLTSVERIGRSQLIPGVRRALQGDRWTGRMLN